LPKEWRVFEKPLGGARGAMSKLIFGIATLIALMSTANAETINLLCGLDFVSIDVTAKYINIRIPLLDKTKNYDYATQAFRDGYKYRAKKAFSEEQEEYQQYVSISDDTIDFGVINLNDKNRSQSYRIDRRTGLFVFGVPEGLLGTIVDKPSSCSLLSSKRLF
jgi:hypothetical protein